MKNSKIINVIKKPIILKTNSKINILKFNKKKNNKIII